MTTNLAIQKRDGSYSDHWIPYCKEHAIPYRIVNCLALDAIQQLDACSYLLWHWSHNDPREHMAARHVITAAEAKGIKVFPSTSTCWHFDDKVAQKYLLEAIGAPLATTYVFFDLGEALEWAKKTSFPKVFKLRKGAGSVNVRLVCSLKEAQSLIKQAFSSGFRPINIFSSHREASARLRRAHTQGRLLDLATRIPKLWGKMRDRNRAMGNERNYVYFQDFIPCNLFDTRITIIGNRAFGFTRNVRDNDFRASGSGDIVYDLERIDVRCIKTAFEVTRKIGAQSLAFDFVASEHDQPFILEISYCFDAKAVYACPGHWDEELNWREGHMWPQEAILLDLLKAANPNYNN